VADGDLYAPATITGSFFLFVPGSGDVLARTQLWVPGRRSLAGLAGRSQIM